MNAIPALLIFLCFLFVTGCSDGGLPTPGDGPNTSFPSSNSDDDDLPPDAGGNFVEIDLFKSWDTAEGLRAFISLPRGVVRGLGQPTWHCGVDREDLYWRFKPSPDSDYQIEPGLVGTVFTFEHTLDTDYELIGSMDFNVLSANEMDFNNELWTFTSYKEKVWRFGANSESVMYRKSFYGDLPDGRSFGCNVRCLDVTGWCQLPRGDLPNWVTPV